MKLSLRLYQHADWLPAAGRPLLPSNTPQQLSDSAPADGLRFPSLFSQNGPVDAPGSAESRAWHAAPLQDFAPGDAVVPVYPASAHVPKLAAPLPVIPRSP